MTTAACLWASACTGLAIGAGFYECVLLAFLLIPLVTRAPPYVESYIVENARNMNIYVEFRSLDDVGDGGLVRRRLTSPISRSVFIWKASLCQKRTSRLPPGTACFLMRTTSPQAFPYWPSQKDFNSYISALERNSEASQTATPP